jgi:hypothetical protein
MQMATPAFAYSSSWSLYNNSNCASENMIYGPMTLPVTKNCSTDSFCFPYSSMDVPVAIQLDQTQAINIGYSITCTIFAGQNCSGDTKQSVGIDHSFRTPFTETGCTSLIEPLQSTNISAFCQPVDIGTNPGNYHTIISP